MQKKKDKRQIWKYSWPDRSSRSSMMLVIVTVPAWNNSRPTWLGTVVEISQDWSDGWKLAVRQWSFIRQANWQRRIVAKFEIINDEQMESLHWYFVSIKIEKANEFVSRVFNGEMTNPSRKKSWSGLLNIFNQTDEWFSSRWIERKIRTLISVSSWINDFQLNILFYEQM